ncbi:MAG: hypothetical protein K8J31_25980 [Anaerolineae bacterium]|nr:hypothetical protein [Anaerolineae bacterium]
MHDNYFSFLDYRAAQRRLVKKFSRPRWLLVNTLAFVATMTGVWLFGNAWSGVLRSLGATTWSGVQSHPAVVFIGVLWSIGLAWMALHQYRRSAARRDRREEVIEDEMRALIHKHSDMDQQTLFDTHHQLEAEFEQEGQWFVALASFAVINALSWLISAFVSVGSSWPFQTTLPFALFFVGGIKAFLVWQQQRRDPDRRGWFVRLPLRHAAVYILGIAALALASMFRLMNYWDADYLIKLWSLLLLAQTGWNVILTPLIEHFTGKTKRAEFTEKPKPDERLMLADDGEILNPIADVWEDQDPRTLEQQL